MLSFSPVRATCRKGASANDICESTQECGDTFGTDICNDIIAFGHNNEPLRLQHPTFTIK